MPWLRAARLRSPKHMRRQPECDAGSTACDHGEDSLPVPGDVDAGWPMDSAEAQAHKDFEEAAQALADAHLNDPTLGENTMGLQETTAALHSALDGLHAKGDSAKHRSAEDAARQMQSRGFGSEDEHLRTKQMKLELRKREPRALAVAASDTIGRLCRKIAGVLRVDEKRLHLRTTFAGDDAAGILLGSDLEDAILNGHDFLCQTSETVKDAGAQKLQIYLAEGPRVATAGSDNFLRIFDLERGREILRYRHSDVVRVVAWSPAGDVVATGTADGAVRLYDLFHGELVDAFQHDLPIRSLHWDTKARFLASGGEDGCARIFNVVELVELQAVPHDGAVSSVAFRQDGRRLATGCEDGFARILLAPTGHQLMALRHSSPVRSVAWNPAGSCLATASAAEINLFREDDGRRIASFIYEGSLSSVAWSPCGDWLAVGTLGGVYIQGMEEKSAHMRLLRSEGLVNDVSWSADGSRLAYGSNNTECHVYDVANGQASAVITHERSVLCVDWARHSPTVSGRSMVGFISYDALFSAVVKLQSVARRWLKRRAVQIQRTKKYEKTLYVLARHMKTIIERRRRARRETEKATVLQAHWRGFLSRKQEMRRKQMAQWVLARLRAHIKGRKKAIVEFQELMKDHLA
eukprot:TRINITY_DN16562_c0_g1_i8.p1 TRINITY_DN16562_c0_g1~~TRINITY_DN16562_c0_g1_i8.p1  ORF type:complete len:636 (+),score=129.05 TRINITY_DN16562_c0_g1_i8:136-2043(+)